MNAAPVFIRWALEVVSDAFVGGGGGGAGTHSRWKREESVFCDVEEGLDKEQKVCGWIELPRGKSKR